MDLAIFHMNLVEFRIFSTSDKLVVAKQHSNILHFHANQRGSPTYSLSLGVLHF